MATKKAEKAMKVLVTGSHGVLGSIFVELLKKRGVPYVSYDREHPESIDSHITAVVHFGGLTPHSFVRGSAPSESDYYAANVAGTAILLAALSNTKRLVRFVNIGSAAECGFSPLPINEGSICHPEGAYGQSKYFQSVLVENFARSRGVKTFNLRIFNVMGFVTRSAADGFVSDRPHLFSTLATQFRKDAPLVIRVNSGNDVRDFVDSEDVLDAIMLALTTDAGNEYELVNICSGIGTSVADVAEDFGNVLHLPYKLKSAFNHKHLSVGVSDKAKRLLKWQATRTLERSIRKYLGVRKSSK